MPASRPHVAIDARMADAPGIGTYLRNLVPRVISNRPEWRFTLIGAPARIREFVPASERVSLHRSAAPVYTVHEQLALSPVATRRFDAFWSPHYNIPVIAPPPLLVTVHDVIHLARPEYTMDRAKSMYARNMFRMVRHRAKAIITVSEFTRAELERVVPDARRVPTFVAHNGVDDSWFDGATEVSTEAAAGRPYIVCVASLKPHKNVGALITAFASIAGRIPHDLVVVGPDTGLLTPDTNAKSSAEPLGDRVRFMGRVSDAALRALVRGAAIAVHPALYEGFGLPPLEAMAAGRPCVVARAASLPEVCGDAALYCDPHDPADIARQICRLIDDDTLRRTLIAKGTARASCFKWTRSTEITLAALEHVLG